MSCLKIEILKTHGSENDFILINEYSNDYGFSDDDRVLLTQRLCDRKKSIGADGILFVQKSDVADGRMRIFNTDGTEPEMCGNGLRIAGRFILELLKRDSAEVETMKAVLNVRKVGELYPDVTTIEVAIGPVNFDVATLPMVSSENNFIDKKIPELSDELTFTALSIPNPHIITLVDEVDSSMVEEIGKKANETKSVFPKGVNVSFVKNLGDGTIFVQTYERGVGITNSCGTAMSSSSLVTCLLGLNEFNSEVTVLNNGGIVKCFVSKQDETYGVKLMGNATYVFKGTVDFDFANPDVAVYGDRVNILDEVANYERLKEYASQLNK